VLIVVTYLYSTEWNTPAYCLNIGTQNNYCRGHMPDVNPPPSGAPKWLEANPYVEGPDQGYYNNDPKPQLGLDLPLSNGETITLQLSNQGTFIVEYDIVT
jgi:hypothetical protein